MSPYTNEDASLTIWKNTKIKHDRLSVPVVNLDQNANFFPFRVYVKEVSVPSSYLNSAERKTYDFGINLMLYDSKAKTFYNQYESSGKQLSLANRATFEMMVYFGFDKLDDNCYLVAEVVSKHDQPRKSSGERCLGFAAIKLLTEAVNIQNIRLALGSSRSLLFIEDPSKMEVSLAEDVYVSMNIQKWPNLDKVKNFLPRNVIIPCWSDIPGVLPGGINTEFPAVGADNFSNPQNLSFSVVCQLSNISVKMQPDTTTVESTIQELLMAEIEEDQRHLSRSKVTSRILKIGLHNGLRYVSEFQLFGLMLSNDGILVPEKTVENISINIPQHPAFALICQLELMFSEVTSSSIFKKSSPPKVFHVHAGWTGISPFGTPSGVLSNSPFSLTMMGQNEYFQCPDGTLSFDFNSIQDKAMLLNFNMSLNSSSQPIITPFVQSSSPPEVTSAIPTVAISNIAQTPVPGAQTTQETPIHRSFQPLTAQSVSLFPEDSLIQKPWPVEVKHLVEEEQNISTVGSAIVYRHPGGNQLAVTPVHVPMPPLPPLPVASLPRSAYAQLYSAGFPIIRDRHGDLPEVVDPVSAGHGVPPALNFASEKSDPLQGNEIVFQFLALSSFSHTTSNTLDQPQSVFFTFQFYNFAPITTERMMMSCGDKLIVNDPNERMASLFILRAIDHKTGALSVQPPGCQVKFAIDSSVLKPGEEDAFWQYLLSQSLHIDVWDGDSLMLIGSCSVPIRFLLRQGREAVQLTMEMDIFSTEYGSLTSNIIADVTRAGSARYIDVSATLKGRLHLRLANIGYVTKARPIVGKSTALARYYGNSSGRLTVVESQTTQRQIGALESRLNLLKDQNSQPVTGRTRVGRGAHLLEAAGNKAILDAGGVLAGVSLANDLMSAGAAGESLVERTRKLRRFHQTLESPRIKAEETSALAHNAGVVAYKQARDTREQNYRNMEAFRDRGKHQSILSLLCDSITSRHEIVTSFGRAEYFEFMLRNPTNDQHIVKIECPDSDLTVVTDVNEWRFFRRMLGEPSSLAEEKMFHVDAANPHIPEVFLKPREIVRIPFKYQTFKGYRAVDDESYNQEKLSGEQILEGRGPIFTKPNFNKRKLTIHFTSVTNKEDSVNEMDLASHQLAILEIDVELQPHVTDQAFRLYSPENSFLRKAIRLPPYNLPGSTSLARDSHKFVARCSDTSVIAEVRNNGPSEPQDIVLRIAVGSSPNIRNINLAIFSDPYQANPIQIWEFWVHALQRYDVTCAEGETSKFSLVLRGSNSTRLVRCFTSHANELAVEPSVPFMMVGNAVHEIALTLSPLATGQRLMIVNVVDLQIRQLIRSWLVCVSVEPPAYSGYFDLALPTGPAGQTHNKKLAYKNPFGQVQNFHLKTNRSDLLTFKEVIMAKVGPEETRDIGLRFASSQLAGSVELAVYVNDEQDRNIESVCIRLTYIPPERLQNSANPSVQAM